MDRLEKKKRNQEFIKTMEKLRAIKITSYDQLINYIPDPKSVGGFIDKTVSISKTKPSKKTVYGRGKKLRKTKKKQKKSFYTRREQKQIKDRVIGDIWTLFATEEEKKEKERN